jgi:DNA (cytosine-5)-methyltransferase 1
MAVYYNEVDPFAAAWLRNLMKEGLIPDGEVDTRSVIDVRPSDLGGFKQCHFFAGIAGWSHALRLAGWADDREIWTGSCPCQPFSVAGKGKGTADERHLWPVFFNLIRECRPPVVMGEQVAGKAGYGWLDGVAADLEGEDYACRAVDIPACAVNAPHIRQRLYWVAVQNMDDAKTIGRQLVSGERPTRLRAAGNSAAKLGSEFGDRDGGLLRDMADTNCRNPRAGRGDDGEMRRISAAQRQSENSAAVFGGSCEGHRDMADADDAGREGRLVLPQRADERSAWSDGVEWRSGADGKARRVKSGVRLLVDGVPNRVGRLRGFGNAIVPPLAAEVISAMMEAL